MLDHKAPTCDEIEEIARDTVAALPEMFRGAASAVALRVADFADEAVLRDLDCDPF